ncbi:hypothetical protein MCBG_00385 [Micromonospora sp. M42]|nr:hypothetical protein MCBG_00385 [Micromonospora sp. M42]
MDDLERPGAGVKELTGWLEPARTPEEPRGSAPGSTRPRRAAAGGTCWPPLLAALLVVALPPGRAALADAVTGLLRFSGVVIDSAPAPPPTGTPSPLPAHFFCRPRRGATPGPLPDPGAVPPGRAGTGAGGRPGRRRRPPGGQPALPGRHGTAGRLRRLARHRVPQAVPRRGRDAHPGRWRVRDLGRRSARAGVRGPVGHGTGRHRAVVRGHAHLGAGLAYVDRSGTERVATARLSAATLIWEQGGLSYRLEGDLTREQALDVAASLR